MFLIKDTQKLDTKMSSDPIMADPIEEVEQPVAPEQPPVQPVATPVATPVVAPEQPPLIPAKKRKQRKKLEGVKLEQARARAKRAREVKAEKRRLAKEAKEAKPEPKRAIVHPRKTEVVTEEPVEEKKPKTRSRKGMTAMKKHSQEVLQAKLDRLLKIQENLDQLTDDEDSE